MKITLLKDHNHAGKDYKPGDEIEVSERQAKWLVSIGAAISSPVIPSPSAVMPSGIEASHPLKDEILRQAQGDKEEIQIVGAGLALPSEDNSPSYPLKLRREQREVTENKKPKGGKKSWKKKFIP